MKERYVKPAIYMESFALTQAIARPCGDTHTSTLGESTHYNESTCVWDAGGIALFLDTNSKCDYPMEDGDELEGVCYNNPDGGQEVFSST